MINIIKNATTKIRSMTLIYFAGSINFKTDEYCLQLHLEVIERNIHTFPPWRSSVLIHMVTETKKCLLLLFHIRIVFCQLSITNCGK